MLEVETTLEPSAPEPLKGRHIRLPSWAVACEAAVFLIFTVFFFPTDSLPFSAATASAWSAQTSLAMRKSPTKCLTASTPPTPSRSVSAACVTPYLYGHPWLEKPALYYWRAMFLFQDFGVHDWSARLPSTTFAFVMAGLIYLHMRRFRPGGHMDAALITVACAGIIGFARGASTDTQMAAPLAIGLLGGTHGTRPTQNSGSSTFTSSPVLPPSPKARLRLSWLSLIVAAFAFLRREWSTSTAPCGGPASLLYFAIVLPWFIAVQRKNPTFFREFFLEHNLERFATDRYQHPAVLVLRRRRPARHHALDRYRRARPC